MSTYAYRPMTTEDYDEAFSLWEKTPGIGLSEADSRENIEMYLRHNPGQSFVCKVDRELIGTVLCGNDGRRAYIHHTAVVPKYRRKGIASELVRLAMAAQKERGMQKCHIFIIADNDEGMAFWREAGFVKRHDIGIMSKTMACAM